MSHHDIVLLVNIGLAVVLSWLIGFEREARGAPAGDRTFALVGTGSAAITSVTLQISPAAIGGVVTGIGFLGAALLFRADKDEAVVGLTTAASIWVVSGIGVVCGTGHRLMAIALAIVVLVDLEIRHIPYLRYLDARRYHDRVRQDTAPPHEKRSSSS